MNSWQCIELDRVIRFNPPERIAKDKISKKISMDQVEPFQKKIKGFELVAYNAGPKFRNGDTLLAKITPCLENGKTAHVDILDDGEVAFGSSEFIVLRNNENSVSDFIFYLARSPAFRKKAISCMEGTSGRKRVVESTLKMQKLLIPDIPTQKKIVDVLSILDSKIELNNRINSELEAMAKILYNYWFVQFDFPDENGKPYKTSGGKMVWNEELKREIPKGWEARRLKEIENNIITGKTPPTGNAEFYNGNIPFITIGDIRGNTYICNAELSLSQIGADFQKNKYIPEGSLCVSCIASPGIIGFTSKRAQTNQQINSIVFQKEENKEYVFFALNDYFKFAKGAKTGNTFLNMNKGDFEGILLLYPKKEHLARFSQITRLLFKQILIFAMQNQQLTELRDWLLPMLMNSQVKVV